jgi:7-cyano-7-deazaguanine reductase
MTDPSSPASGSALPLGRQTDYPDVYDPGQLYPIERADNRARLGLQENLPFHGEDVWTAYELSWLLPSGKPAIALAECRIPAHSPRMIESKSFKLYLNSFNQHVFADADAVRQTLVRDLSRAVGAEVGVKLKDGRAQAVGRFGLAQSGAEVVMLDRIEANDFVYRPDAGLLLLDPRLDHVEQVLVSDLLRSNCPVTGQPDWASVIIRYAGLRIDPVSVLRYIVSFRQCQDFHEHCVERIFVDLLARVSCENVSVYARYTRRGGLDINPYRATRGFPVDAPELRLIRQ